jgi:cytochrome b subunit of formate dehydrogenase
MVTAVQTESTEKSPERKITRFDVHQIIQHAGLMTSFILLVVTGLPLKFSSAGISQWWIMLWGGINSTRSVHHFAAWMMAAVCLYHIVYFLYGMLILKKPFPAQMLPSLNDGVQYYQEMAYYLGIKKEKPQVGRFNWKEKFDYWAIFWGMPVMFVSGFIMMYPVWITKFLPGWFIPAALVAHSDEAMLALIWIVLMHIFFNHFSPGVFPVNTSIFTGKVTRERYQREHALEYKRLLGTPKAEDTKAEDKN